MLFTIAMEIGLFEALYKNADIVYSPKLLIKTKRKPDQIPGEISGSTIFERVVIPPAPRLVEASEYWSFNFWYDMVTERTAMGSMLTKYANGSIIHFPKSTELNPLIIFIAIALAGNANGSIRRNSIIGFNLVLVFVTVYAAGTARATAVNAANKAILRLFIKGARLLLLVNILM